MTLTYGSLFSGIGGFDLGFDAAGFSCAFQVEKDKNCNQVLGRHWPAVSRHEEIESFRAASTAVRPDVICGGFPCQDISVAGRRAGLAGKRSGLWWEFHRILGEFRPRWVCIENVGGLLSSNQGKDLGAVLWALGNLGYWWAYRCFDSQWFGLAQRRLRVFIVGCLGDVRRWPLQDESRIRRLPAEVLFERTSLPWDSPPSREAEAQIAGTVAASPPSRRNGGSCPTPGHLVAATINSGGNSGGFRTEPGERLIPFDTTQVTSKLNRNSPKPGDPCHPLAAGMHAPAIAYRTSGNCGVMEQGDKTAALNCGTDQNQQIITEPIILRDERGRCGDGLVSDKAFPLHCAKGMSEQQIVAEPFIFESRIGRNDRGQPSDVVPTLKGSQAGDTSDMRPCVAGGSQRVRRLTPREYERLQGFPDDFTRWGVSGNQISDSGRYRMLGNAVSTPVARWIARRIASVVQTQKDQTGCSP